jgi:hypothetical protein
MRRWEGATRERVVAAWGEPDGETALRDGRTALTWMWRWGFWPLRRTCRQSFTLGRDGVVEEWSYSKCPPFQSTR